MNVMTSRFLRLARLLSLATLLPLAAQAADYTDLWWNPDESGWGVNVVQSDNFMFVTFYIYGQDNKPTWLTAQLAPDGQGAYSGGLYANTSGTHYAKPWNTGDAIPAQQVGSAQFRPSADNDYQATLTYVVVGAGTVVTAIERQSLTAINLAGAYTGGLAGVQSGCSNGGSYHPTYDLQVQQNASAFSMTFTFPAYACTLAGTLVQHGRQYDAANAEYKCTQGGNTVLSTAARISELRATAQGIEGRWVAPVGGGCTETAYFSAVLL